ncbi:MAG: hypothetical protein ACRDS0_05105 [Pseudonocardiaceae bacterium]
MTGWERLPTTGSAAKPAARRAPEFGPSAASALYVLQRTAGNRAVTRLLQRAAGNCAVAWALANPQVQRQPTHPISVGPVRLNHERISVPIPAGSRCRRGCARRGKIR